MSGARALRKAIAAEAARLMLTEDVGEYYNAKRMAAENLVGMRAGDISLPSNRDVRAAILQQTSLEGVSKASRLRHMRQVALDLMERLARFDPRLIGSVASGAIHRRSDIDLHVFCVDHADLEHALWLEGVVAERIDRDVQKDGGCRRYVHYVFDVQHVPVELSVYDPEELRRVSLSSIDGKPIDRVPKARVARLLAQMDGR
jgi:predicted nucleotidyltransferase